MKIAARRLPEVHRDWSLTHRVHLAVAGNWLFSDTHASRVSAGPGAPGHLLRQRRSPSSTIAWLLVILLLPYVGCAALRDVRRPQDAADGPAQGADLPAVDRSRDAAIIDGHGGTAAGLVRRPAGQRRQPRRAGDRRA